MVQSSFITLGAAAAVLATLPAHVLALYPKNSPVLQVDAKSYASLIADSNHTSILEFYAPWCGHCQNLKPAYEKAAKSLAGLAKVAAINCDEESNKPFCGGMGVQGFPTLKIIRPGKKKGRPNIEDYQGARSAKGIVDAVLDKLPNHVRRVGDKDIEGWLKESNDTAKAILFTNKGTTSAQFKALAVDFLGGISFAQIRDKEKAAVEMFGIKSFPTLVLLPGADKEAMVLDSELNKDSMSAFLSQVRSPNPDPAPKSSKAAKASAKKEKPTKDKKQQVLQEEKKTAYEQAASSHASEEASEAARSATSITLEEQGTPTESPDPAVPVADAPEPQQVLDVPPPIPLLESDDELKQSCLAPKSSTCIIALIPGLPEPDSLPSQAVIDAQANLAQIVQKHVQRHAAIFPFYAVPLSNPGAATVRSALALEDDSLEIVAVNARRGWWRRFDGDTSSLVSIEDWIDAIRLGEGKKEKLPEELVNTSDEEEKKEKHDEL